MTDKPRSRHIPKEVVTQLLEAQRHRCCVRSPVCGGVLLDPSNYDPEALAETLDKHHIVMFSEGGEHTEDNLLLACDNCHDQIHRHPDKYPPDVLREKKEHWVGMRDVVPAELELLGKGEDTIQVTYSVERANLQYMITAPAQATIGDLELLIRDEILMPLGKYTGRNELIIDGLPLARLSVLKKSLSTNLSRELRLDELELEPGDVLIGYVFVRILAYPRRMGLLSDLVRGVDRIVDTILSWVRGSEDSTVGAEAREKDRSLWTEIPLDRDRTANG